MRSFYFYWRPEGLFGIFIVLHLLVLGFIIWMLVDAITRPPEEFSTPNAKTGWIVGLAASILFPIPGFIVGLVYFFSVRQQAATRGASNRMQNPAGQPSPDAWTATGSPPPPPTPGPPLPTSGPTPPPNCRNCGAKLVAGARFCHSCGTPIA
jgi:hypothetical protein